VESIIPNHLRATNIPFFLCNFFVFLWY
jgi:hypothetical protein